MSSTPTLLERVTDQLREVLPDDPTNTPRPQLYAYTALGGWHGIGDASDPYDLLVRLPEMIGDNGDTVDSFALLCTGWAAPLNENGEADGAPSEHPDRVRVAVTVVIVRDGSACSLLFREGEDGTGEVGPFGTGALAEAVDSAALAVWGRDFSASVVSSWLYAREDDRDSVDARALSARVSHLFDLIGEAMDDEDGGR